MSKINELELELELLGTSYKVSEIISLKKFAIFMRKGKQYIMLTIYKHLLEMMP